MVLNVFVGRNPAPSSPVVSFKVQAKNIMRGAQVSGWRAPLAGRLHTSKTADISRLAMKGVSDGRNEKRKCQAFDWESNQRNRLYRPATC
jgi:hypothetical protein